MYKLRLRLKVAYLKLSGKIPKPKDILGTKEFSPAPNASGQLGEIRWRVIDCIAGTESEIHESQPDLSEAKVSWLLKKNDSPLETRVISLDEEWELSLSCGKKEYKSGFAINAMRNSSQEFAWDWFVFQTPNFATKLQEEGRLLLKVQQVADSEEIVEVEFLTDVSFRTSRFEHLFENPLNTQNPEWRVVVFAGSKVTFPVVIEGTIKIPGT